jgi:hypothetical protein
MTYTFNKQPAPVSFAGSHLSVAAQSLKWSIDLEATELYNSSASSAGTSTPFSYNISQQSSSSLAIGKRNLQVTAVSNIPVVNMTTYYLLLGDTSSSSSSSSEGSPNVIQLQIFDVALVDDNLTRIEHSVNIINNSYVLLLVMPPFNHSLQYDPILGLGVLVSSGGGKNNGNNNIVVIAVAVAVPVAGIVVLGVAIVGSWVLYSHKKKSRKSLKRLTTFTL